MTDFKTAKGFPDSALSGSHERLIRSPVLDRPRPSPEGAGSTIDSPRRLRFGSAFCTPELQSVPRGPTDLQNDCPGCNSMIPTPPSSNHRVVCVKCRARLGIPRSKVLELSNARELSDEKSKLEAVRVPVKTVDTWSEHGHHCDVCASHLHRSKPAAVRMICAQEHTVRKSPPSISALVRHPVSSLNTLPKISRPCSSATVPKQKSSSLGMDTWAEGHQHLKSLSVSHGITPFPHKAPVQDSKEAKTGTVPSALGHCGSPVPSLSSRVPAILPAGASAALAFFVRAAQKLSSRRLKQSCERCPSHCPTHFSRVLQRAPPPVPPQLMRALNKKRELPLVGKVSVMVRVCPFLTADMSQSHFLRLDTGRKQVTVLDPAAYVPQSQAPPNPPSPKTFTFDAVLGPESSQAEVCEGALCDVLQSVLAGADGCILSLGQAKMGTSYTMIGRDDCAQNLGIIPCAIAWLFKLINKKKEMTGADISVNISAVEIWGEHEVLKDLLSGKDPSSPQSGQNPNVHLSEDPICGIQLCNHSVLDAPTADRAASLLDAAIGSCRSCVPDYQHQSHMFFTLHVLQHPVENSQSSKCMVHSKLNFIHLDGCVEERNKSKPELGLADLGNVFMALLNGHVHVPHKDSRFVMLLRDSLCNINCHTVMIAHISPSFGDFSESLSIIQTVSRIRREHKKARKSACNSPGGRSLSKQRKAPPSNRLRPFHSADHLDHDLTLAHHVRYLRNHSGHDKCCDTLVNVDPNGHVLLDKIVTNRTQEMVSIIPSLHIKKPEPRKSLFSCKNELFQLVKSQVTHGQHGKEQLSLEDAAPDKPHQDCFKCNTFAELQERLGCIDGVDLFNMNALKGQHTNTAITTEPLPVFSHEKDMNEIDTIGHLESKASTCQRQKIGRHQKSNVKNDTVIHYCEEMPTPDFSMDSQPQLKNSPSITSVSPTKPTECGQLSLTSNKGLKHTAGNTLPITLSLPLEDQLLFSDNHLVESDIRSSPAGKSSPRSSSSSSSSLSISNNLGSPVIFPRTPKVIIPHCPTENQVKATVTVTVQQPLDLNGLDELVYTVVEEVTIDSGVIAGGRCQNIVSFNSSNSLPAMATGTQPVRIIGSISEEQKAAEVPFQVMTSNDLPTTLPPLTEGNESYPEHEQCLSEAQRPDTLNDVSSDNLVDVHSKREFNVVQTATQSLKEKHAGGDFLDFVSTNVFEHPCVAEKESVMEESVQRAAHLFPGYVSKEKGTSGRSHQGNEQHPMRSKASLLPKTTGQVEEGYSSNNCGATIIPNSEHSCNKPSTEKHDCKDDLHLCTKTGPESCDVLSSAPQSAQNTLERKESSTRYSILSWAKESLLFPSMCKCSPEHRQNANREPTVTNSPTSSPEPIQKPFFLTTENGTKEGSLKSPIEDSSKLFSSRLEHLAHRSLLLGRFHSEQTDLQSLAQHHSVISWGSKGCLVEDSSPAPTYHRHWEPGNKVTSSDSNEEGDSTMSRASRSHKRVPRFVPLHDIDGSHATQQPCRQSLYKSSTASKIMSGPKVCRISVASTKNQSGSLGHSLTRSSSMSPDGVSFKHNAWSTHSLPHVQRSRLTSKSPQRIMNGRVSELLRASGESLSSCGQRSADEGRNLELKGKLTFPVHSVSSPYSRVTAPRRPHHCSGHASDNTSVLSGELPPAMRKTTLLYNRNSLVSSGYESQMKESETAYSGISLRDSNSDQSSSSKTVKGSRNSRKRSSPGSHQRRPSQDTILSLRRSSSGPKVRWVDRDISESYEIKVYEIDDVERLQKKGSANKGVVCFSAKLKFLEHRQQRIAEVRAKYSILKKELEMTKHHLMLDSGKWTREFDLWQTFEVDSLEHLEALELVTERLESRLNLCKACVMMVTCFDVITKSRGKRRCRKAKDPKVFLI